MELQNKFEDIINTNVDSYIYSYLENTDVAAKECAKLCLEEQIKLLSKLSNYQSFSLSNEIEELQQQLKELENGNKYKSKDKEVENNNYPKDTYCIITWANSQMLFEQEWFDECILINDNKGLELYGSSAYLVPIDRYNEFYNIIKPTLYTKEQVDELLQEEHEKAYWEGVDETENKYNITNPNEKYLSISKVEELLQEKSNIINSLCKQIQTLEKLMLDMIEINKVEELLQKQRELCYNSIYWKDDVDKDSILNAKLKI